MKFTLFTLVLIALAITSCTDPVAPNKHKTIMLNANGKVETLPDMASFTLNLSCLNKSVKASKKCLVEKSNELKQTLLSYGIDEKDILTTAVNMNKSYKWNYNKQVFEGYKSSTQMYITVRNLDILDDIYSELLEKRELHIHGLSYNHSKIDSLQNEAYAVALRNANVLADKLLEEVPEDEKELIQVGNVKLTASAPQNNDKTFKGAYEVMEEMNFDGNANTIAISSGTVTVHANLHVEYQIR